MTQEAAPYDTYSEPPARFQPRRDDQKFTPGPSNPQRKSAFGQRTKSVPRNAFADELPMQQANTRPARDRSANYKTVSEPRYNQGQKPAYAAVKSKGPLNPGIPQ